MAETYLKVSEVAERLNVTKQSVYNWINDGRLKAVKVAGKTVRITESSVDALIQPADADERVSGEDARLQEAT